MVHHAAETTRDAALGAAVAGWFELRSSGVQASGASSDRGACRLCSHCAAVLQAVRTAWQVCSLLCRETRTESCTAAETSNTEAEINNIILRHIIEVCKLCCYINYYERWSAIFVILQVLGSRWHCMTTLQLFLCRYKLLRYLPRVWCMQKFRQIEDGNAQRRVCSSSCKSMTWSWNIDMTCCHWDCVP